MKTLLKTAREQKGLKTREVAQILSIDQALISKFETGTRKPTREQLIKLAALLEIDLEPLMIIWLKEKIIQEIGHEEFALQALKAAKEEIKSNRESSVKKVSALLQKLLDEIDLLKAKLHPFRPLENSTLQQIIELEFTHSSNWIEGNTLTLTETDLVVNEGQTIEGKSMREHLEAINHQEALAFIKSVIQKNTPFGEKELLSLHSIILRGIVPKEAGHYRNISISIKDNSFIPAEPPTISKEIDALFNWYESNKNSIHPIILAATVKERLMTIHPFINGNGKVSRLIMNLILLQHGYQIANIKANENERMLYYQTLKASLTRENKENFIVFVAQNEKANLEKCLESSSQ
ncbi:Fic family protein [Flavobacterium granuli]|uniref:Helix-turn-helix domain-containing protein n=1 Tax=Flavobacterium granuli TaxID=280093 RepID=A0A1M5R6B9_9FLAO|nr:Fic family protein [Flavobacterium granuli]PRZ21619.1 helix-turn-helix protein [Flavobacterium granuli]SHH21580.1 Helix-turn-helix domain-containing protein [Flavobacterium granuli]